MLAEQPESNVGVEGAIVGTRQRLFKMVEGEEQTLLRGRALQARPREISFSAEARLSNNALLPIFAENVSFAKSIDRLPFSHLWVRSSSKGSRRDET